MKKVSTLFVFIFIIPFITACQGSSSLSCYEELYQKEFKQTLNINYNKEKTKVDSANINIYVNINEIDLKNIGCNKDTKEECIIELQEKYNNGCNELLENCEIYDKNENGFKFRADIKKDRLDDYFGDISTTLPINQMRYKIETKLGFTCDNE